MYFYFNPVSEYEYFVIICYREYSSVMFSLLALISLSMHDRADGFSGKSPGQR